MNDEPNFVTAEELTDILGLIEALTAFGEYSIIALEPLAISDANGDSLGSIIEHPSPSGKGFVLRLPA